MIDFHNHVLPCIDDGSKSMEQTISMLRSAVNQGITDIICTVHYQHPKMENCIIDYEIVMQKIKEVEENLVDLNIKLHPGAEVFYLPNLVEIKSEPITVFGHGKYMLIEFQNFQMPTGSDKQLYDLKISGTTPIIAHPERYRFIQNDINLVKKLINRGCLMQIDAGSILGFFGKKCKYITEEMIKRNMVHFIGSDAHNDSKRNFCLMESKNRIEELIGENSDYLFYENPKKIITGESISIEDVGYIGRKNIFYSFFKQFNL